MQFLPKPFREQRALDDSVATKRNELEMLETLLKRARGSFFSDNIPQTSGDKKKFLFIATILKVTGSIESSHGTEVFALLQRLYKRLMAIYERHGITLLETSGKLC